MPIIRINNIKGSKGRSASGSLKKAVDYIKDSGKTLQELNQDGVLISHGIEDALTYTTNDVKTLEGHLVSGYLCDPDTAESAFEKTRLDNLERVGKTLEDDTGNIGYHLLISWKEDEKITGQEAMDYGLEFMKKLGHHQAVVAVHTNTDNMHVHIVFNSHTSEPMKDYGAHDRMKYNDSKDTYKQLRVLNDRMSLEKGYDVIKPRKHYEKSQSWFEHTIKNLTDEKGSPISYKQALRNKIDSVKLVTNDFVGFEKGLKDADIDIRYRGKDNNISYKFIEEGQPVRASSLGSEYTRPALEQYYQEKQEPAKVDVTTEREQREQLEREVRQAKQFTNNMFINPRTKRKNGVSYYRSDGTPKSAIELIVSLSIQSLKRNKEFIENRDSAFVVPTNTYIRSLDKKTSQQVSAMSQARKLGINDVTQLADTQKKVGKEMYALNRDSGRVNQTIEKMTYLMEIIEKIDSNQEISTLDMKKLYAASLGNKETQTDFKTRYNEMKLRSEIIEKDIGVLRNEYRVLKSIEHRLNDANNFKYIHEELEDFERQRDIALDKKKDLEVVNKDKDLPTSPVKKGPVK